MYPYLRYTYPDISPFNRLGPFLSSHLTCPCERSPFWNGVHQTPPTSTPHNRRCISKDCLMFPRSWKLLLGNGCEFPAAPCRVVGSWQPAALHHWTCCGCLVLVLIFEFIFPSVLYHSLWRPPQSASGYISGVTMLLYYYLYYSLALDNIDWGTHPLCLLLFFLLFVLLFTRYIVVCLTYSYRKENCFYDPT